MIVAYNREHDVFLTDDDFKPKEYPYRQKHGTKRRAGYRKYYLIKRKNGKQ